VKLKCAKRGVIDRFTGQRCRVADEMKRNGAPYKRDAACRADFGRAAGPLLQAQRHAEVLARMLANFLKEKSIAALGRKCHAARRAAAASRVVPQTGEERRDRGLVYDGIGNGGSGRSDLTLNLDNVA